MTEERIKEKSKQLFFSYGLKSVSMDDVAHSCGISKKSIYLHFEDKNALVCSTVHELIQLHEGLMKMCNSAAINAIDEVVKQVAEPFEIWASIRPSFFYELEKFFPAAWNELELYRLKMHEGIMHNLEWGKEENLYRGNINTAFTAELRLHQLIDLLRRNFITTKHWSIRQSAMELTGLYLQSITTDNGKNALKYFNE